MPTQNIAISNKQSVELIGTMEPTTKEIFIERVKTDSTNSIVDQGTSQSDLHGHEEESSKITSTQWITIGILCFVNLINYMDRFTIAGVLEDVKGTFEINDDLAGLLQTAFVVSYMLFAPLFGYLGDRYNRKNIMAFGVSLWCLMTLAGSFMKTYRWFLFFRALVGIGEASYSTIAPTLISDMFIGSARSKMLAAFYFAIPVGSGLGYIVGSKTAAALKGWQWGLRITPFAGIVAVLLILFVMKEPERGHSEGRSHIQVTAWSEDIVNLFRNRSFMLSTGGFTCVAFVTGALAWWGPHFIYLGLKLQPGHENAKLQDVALYFGLVTVVSGLMGTPCGMILSNWLRPILPQVDPLICGCGLLGSAVIMVLVCLTASHNTPICLALCFIAEFLIGLNWSVANDITLYVVPPNRRSTAEAFQILVSHAFGDAGSPYLIGLLSDTLKNILPTISSVAIFRILFTTSSNPGVNTFKSLQYALFTTCFVEVLGGLFFLLTALHVVKDRAAAERQLTGEDNPVATSDLYSDISDGETGKNS